jgi:transcriptional regulator with XRE-family HTH domain
LKIIFYSGGNKVEEKNFKLIQALHLRRMAQAELVKKCSLSSDARLSRIICGYSQPTEEEIEKICAVLGFSRSELGFRRANGLRRGAR